VKRAGLGLLLLTWLYGVPFLLIVGLIRRSSAPYLASHAAAQAFGATTDILLTAGLILNVVLPVAGWVLAVVLGDRARMRSFAWSSVGVVLIYLLTAVAASMASTPLIGTDPGDHEPAPRVTQCIPVSGGHGCPGG
jgi:hypothetical protein